jgi:hypothetical protein
MELVLVRHLWGVNRRWEEAFPQFRAQGFTAIECALPPAEARAHLRGLLDQHGFPWIAQIFTAGTGVDQHLDSFRAQIRAARELRPRFINAHTGSDAWSMDEMRRFYDAALAIEREEGMAVCHETHRGRCFYSPWVTRDVLLACPALRVCCDFSHWVCVAERLIDSELAIIRLCAERALHVHARVGYEQGPQVPDPRAAEYQRHLEAHERWWDLVWDVQRGRGVQGMTLTPEFGPPDYLHTQPHTGAPVADLWDICTWMGRRQAARFAAGRWVGAALRGANVA